MKLSVVTTIYKSADAVVEFHRRAIEAARQIGAEAEVIFVNDGSPDDGLAIARQVAAGDPRVVVIDLSRNFGQHRALWTGLGYATGDLIAIMDGDLDEDPLWLVEFRNRMAESGCDVVYGVLNVPRRSRLYRSGRRVFYGVLNSLSSVDFPRNVTTARLMTSRYVAALLTFDERELYLAGILHMAGFAQVGVEVPKTERTPTKYTMGRLGWIFINAVTAFSTTPLTAIFMFGILLSLAAVVFIAWLFVRFFVGGVGVEGWTSVMAAIVFFSGVLLFFNGVMAIYIGKIFLEVKRRPLSIVRAVYRDGDKPQ